MQSYLKRKSYEIEMVQVEYITEQYIISADLPMSVRFRFSAFKCKPLCL